MFCIFCYHDDYLFFGAKFVEYKRKNQILRKMKKANIKEP